MTTNISIALEYTPKVHQGHNVNPTTSQYVIYVSDAVGFDWGTLSCTIAEAIAKQQSPSMNPTVVELKFMPV